MRKPSRICPYDINFASFPHLFVSFPVFSHLFAKILFSLSRPTAYHVCLFNLKSLFVYGSLGYNYNLLTDL